MLARQSMSKYQDGEDVHLYDMLFKDDQKPEFFGEIGALDGELFPTDTCTSMPWGGKAF